MKSFNSKLILPFTVVLLLGLFACKKDPIEPNPPVSQRQQPNPLPANALIKQLKWSETDHSTVTYNAENLPLQLRSQWQFVEGDPSQIRTLVYDFQYDSQNRVTEVRQIGGFVTKYSYHGNLVHVAKDFYPGGALANETVFIYKGNQIVQEDFRVTNPLGEAPTVYKRILGYDLKGNLNKVEMYEQGENLEFKLLQTLTYSDFDDKINTRTWLQRYPYLPQVRWQFNNPRKGTIKNGDEQAKTITYVYDYNTEGLPITNFETGPGGTFDMQLLY